MDLLWDIPADVMIVNSLAIFCNVLVRIHEEDS